MPVEQDSLEKHGPTIMLWAGVFFLLVGVVWFGVAIMSYQKATASASWPTAAATITTSRVERSTRRVKNQGTKPYFIPRVQYRYEVDGQGYEGNRIATADHEGSTDQSWADRIVSRYPVNRTVKVHYDPDDHGFAVLESGITKENVFFFAVSAFGVVFGAFLAIMGMIFRRKQKAATAADSAEPVSTGLPEGAS